MAARDDSVFEAGRKIGNIQSFYRTATETSLRFSIMAKAGQFSSTEAMIIGDYGNQHEFMKQVKAYRRELLGTRRVFYSIKRKFPKLAYFMDENNPLRIELAHQSSLSATDEAIAALEGYGNRDLRDERFREALTGRIDKADA